ncbi:hypothetical protein ACP275_14G315900 [Erythranthe tilingii]
MEKPAATKSKNKIMKFLPKAVSFQNIPFSPRRDLRADVNSHRVKALQNKGFSGPMIPAEARRKSKNFETQEPTSPKVSCMGQIKHKSKSKSKISKQKHVSLPKEFKPAETGKIRVAAAVPAAEMATKKKESSGIKKLFGAGRKSDASIDYKRPPISENAPSLNQMRKFASSRDAFANFDWTTAQIAPEEEDRGFYSDDSDDDVIIPFSAPILMAGAGGGVSGLDLEPRKEINLWKRRTMAQPKPLHLDSE